MRAIRKFGSMRGVWKRSYGCATKAPPDERGGNDMLSLASLRHTSTHMGTFGSSGLDSVAHVQNSRIVSVSKV
jgi:hypothetical protein